ncbi:MAG: VanW family protein, partial [Fimbriimonadaceae bacterium]
VGGWSRDRGYRKAPVSYNGQLIDSYGGGVCQTSTTLYNAVLLAGLPVDERHRHRFHATYAPPGRDAAVAYEGIDLKFTNTTRVPLRIEARVRGDLLVVGLRGPLRPPKPGNEVRIVSEVREVVRPTSFVLEGDRPGIRVRNGGKRGFEVSTFREIGDRRELISVDSYPVMHRVLEKGAASPGRPDGLQ